MGTKSAEGKPDEELGLTRDPAPVDDEAVTTGPSQDRLVSQNKSDSNKQDRSLTMEVPNRELSPSGRFFLRRNVRSPKRLAEQLTVRDELL